jgi:hypothetical protein
MEMYVTLQLVNVVYVNLNSSETSAIKVNKNAYGNLLANILMKMFAIIIKQWSEAESFTIKVNHDYIH